MIGNKAFVFYNVIIVAGFFAISALAQSPQNSAPVGPQSGNGGGGGGSTSPGGSDTQVQYNNAGSFGGASGLTYDNANNVAQPGADNTNDFGKTANRFKTSWNYTMSLKPVTVASLPTPSAGMDAAVSDGTASLAIGATVTGGGSTYYRVTYTGANWIVTGNGVVSATPGGSDTQFQFNNAGVFAGSSSLLNNIPAVTCGMFGNCIVVGGALEPFLSGNIVGIGNNNGTSNWLAEFAVANAVVKNSGARECWSSAANGSTDANGLRTGIDTCFSRNAAGVIEVNNGTPGTFADIKIAKNQAGILYSAAGTALPSCVAGLKGTEATVSDATAPLYGVNYTSGGTVTVKVLCDGTNWKTY